MIDKPSWTPVRAGELFLRAATRYLPRMAVLQGYKPIGSARLAYKEDQEFMTLAAGEEGNGADLTA